MTLSTFDAKSVLASKEASSSQHPSIEVDLGVEPDVVCLGNLARISLIYFFENREFTPFGRLERESDPHNNNHTKYVLDDYKMKQWNLCNYKCTATYNLFLTNQLVVESNPRDEDVGDDEDKLRNIARDNAQEQENKFDEMVPFSAIIEFLIKIYPDFLQMN